MKADTNIKQVLIPSQQIQARIAQLGKQISQDYAGKTLYLVGVLKGSWMYLADLSRQLTVDTHINFISASSYGDGTQTTGQVKIKADLTDDCRGKDVLIVEDIIDSGITLSNLCKMFLQRGANSVQVTTLLSKPARRQVQVDVKYIGFEIPDEFVVGYGMDFAEDYRHLQDVCVLKPEAYSH